MASPKRSAGVLRRSSGQGAEPIPAQDALSSDDNMHHTWLRCCRTSPWNVQTPRRATA